jgi:2'-5' RNA ligase
MRFLVTLLLSEKELVLVDVIKKKYDQISFYKLRSHITLYPPFLLAGEYDNLLYDLNRAVEHFSSFKIATIGLSTFRNGVLFLGIDCGDTLLTLYNDIKECIYFKHDKGRRRLKKVYTPHLTLIQKGRPKEIEWAKEELTHTNLPQSFFVSGILVYEWRNGEWRKCDTLNFPI